MFKFLKDKLKQGIASMSKAFEKEAKEEEIEVEKPAEEIIEDKKPAKIEKVETKPKEIKVIKEEKKKETEEIKIIEKEEKPKKAEEKKKAAEKKKSTEKEEVKAEIIKGPKEFAEEIEKQFEPLIEDKEDIIEEKEDIKEEIKKVEKEKAKIIEEIKFENVEIKEPEVKKKGFFEKIFGKKEEKLEELKEEVKVEDVSKIIDELDQEIKDHKDEIKGKHKREKVEEIEEQIEQVRGESIEGIKSKKEIKEEIKFIEKEKEEIKKEITKDLKKELDHKKKELEEKNKEAKKREDEEKRKQIEKQKKEDEEERLQREKEIKERAEKLKEKIQEKKKEAVEVEEIKEEPKKKGIFGFLKEKITTQKIDEKQFDHMFWELEVAMMENNVAIEVIDKIKNDLKEELVDVPIPRGKVPEKIEASLKTSIESLFEIDNDIDIIAEIKNKKATEKKPYIICFVGVNGSGKTTTIAKFAYMLQQENLKPVIAAADTFRAAAIQQLEEHGKRLNVRVIKQDYNADPAAVAFDAIKYAEAKSIDVVLIDTAGRLHSNVNLMDEMKKIVRVAKPDFVIFVGESITGNDCVEQAKKFNESTPLNGIILSKADIDEKGGAAISVSYVTGKPILFLGTGQEYPNLEPFDKEKLLDSIFG